MYVAELDRFKMKIGDAPPDFTLPGTDGREHSLSEHSTGKLLLVVFSCNHCPYAQAWEGRLISLGKEYAPRGMETVVINPNETINYPDDTLEKMAERARSKAYPFAYLRDDSQETARSYGALVTPHPFLFQPVAPPKSAPLGIRGDEGRPGMRLVYQGKVDDNWKDPAKVTHRYLKDAIESALAGRSVISPTTSVIGCTVKWKPDGAQ